MMILLLLPATAATLQVGPTATYSTINAALAASNAGDTISVAPGTYAESLDLRGKTITLSAQEGPYSTTISTSASIYMDGGTIEGFTVSPAGATAISISGGAPVVREMVILAPSSYGVAIGAGTATVEETLVVDAGHSGFYVGRDSPSIRRSISIDAVKYNFYLKGGGALANSLSIGAPYGIVVQTTTATVQHSISLDATLGALVAAANTTFENGVYANSPFVVVCNGGEPTFPNGIGNAVFAAKSCGASALTGLTDVDPRFAAWTTGGGLYDSDFSPGAGSPLDDGGTGLDLDGSVADLGLFGGNTGAWRDRDGDGVPVVFDCDDHTDTRYPGAPELADGLDQDCDGEIDEDIIIDTGDTGGDTGVDTGVDTGTDTSGSVDIDHDGFTADVDCGDHNIASYPGATEILDSVDNDCDGRVDEGTAGGDDDGDGWSVLGGDCDDTDPFRSPAAEETPRNGIDEDCDGVDSSPKRQDNDDDGHTDETDCDDTNASVHPGAADPTNGVDDDCDGQADDDALNADGDGDGVTPMDGDCADADPTRHAGATDIADDYIDQDCTGQDNYDVDRDGHASPASGGTDCDDLRSTTYVGAAENCDDGVDNDCDGAVDQACTPDIDDGGDESCNCGTGGALAFLPMLAAIVAGIRRRR